MNHSLKLSIQGTLVLLAVWVCSAFAAHHAGSPLSGDVAVGRVKRQGPPVDALVTAIMSDGLTQTTRTTSDGTIVFSEMPYGPTTFTVVPVDTTLQSQTFVVDMGPIQENVILVHAVPVAPVTDIESYELEPASAVHARVGRAIPFRATVRGGNAKRLSPTLWIDGGTGSITPGGMFLPRRAGAGTLRSELLGSSRAVSVTVDP